MPPVAARGMLFGELVERAFATGFFQAQVFTAGHLECFLAKLATQSI